MASEERSSNLLPHARSGAHDTPMTHQGAKCTVTQRDGHTHSIARTRGKEEEVKESKDVATASSTSDSTRVGMGQHAVGEHGTASAGVASASMRVTSAEEGAACVQRE